MTARRANPPIIKTKSVDPRVVADHAVRSVRDGRLMMQAVADVLVYAADAAFRKEGSSLEAADATIALARRFAQGNELEGDRVYGVELYEALTAQSDQNTARHNELFNQGRRGPDPAVHYVTDVAYWAAHLFGVASLSEVPFEPSRTSIEELLKNASILGWLVGEQPAPVRVFVASINGGLRDAEGATPAPKRQRTAARGPRRRT